MRDVAHAILSLCGWSALALGAVACLVTLFSDTPMTGTYVGAIIDRDALWALRFRALASLLAGAVTWAGCIIAVGMSEESREVAHALKKVAE